VNELELCTPLALAKPILNTYTMHILVHTLTMHILLILGTQEDLIHLEENFKIL
jgi:hypothetical protein